MMTLDMRGRGPEWLLAAHLDMEVESGVFRGPRPLAFDVLTTHLKTGTRFVATIFPEITDEQEHAVRQEFADVAIHPHKMKVLASIAKRPGLAEKCGLVCTKKTEYVYFIQIGDAGSIKIGTSNNPRSRIATLQTASHQPMRLIGMMPGGVDAETKIHAMFSQSRIRGEWFNPTPELKDFILHHATPQ